jgi:RIP metalloprotease RseP
VLRKDVNNIEKPVTITAYPRELNGRIVIGVFIEPDFNNLVIAETIADRGGKKLIDIPSGARITSVGGVGVWSFYDFAREMKNNLNRDVLIKWQDSGGKQGEAVFGSELWAEVVPVESIPILSIPFEQMQRLYKAEGILDAVKMGYNRTLGFIRIGYATIVLAVKGQVSPKSFMGPIGLVTFGYQIVTHSSKLYYLYIIGMISALIGAVNTIPLLPFDGGHIVFLLIEKIKGSPVSERIQASFLTAGVVLLLALAIYITFNDVIRIRMFV